MGYKHKFFKGYNRAAAFAQEVKGELGDADSVNYELLTERVEAYGEDYREQGFNYVVLWEQ